MDYKIILHYFGSNPDYVNIKVMGIKQILKVKKNKQQYLINKRVFSEG